VTALTVFLHRKAKDGAFINKDIICIILKIDKFKAAKPLEEINSITVSNAITQSKI
jgi:hypothetical protein